MLTYFEQLKFCDGNFLFDYLLLKEYNIQRIEDFRGKTILFFDFNKNQRQNRQCTTDNKKNAIHYGGIQ